MAEKNRLQIIMEDPTEQTSCILIGEMPTVSQNPLFEIIRVFSNLKHADVMICFQKHRIQILQIFYNVIIIFSKVRGNAHRMLSTFQAVTHRLCSIMGNGKRIYRQVLDPKRLILPDLVDQSLRHFSKGFHTKHGICCSTCGIDGNSIFSGDHSQSLDMVGMFMCDQDTVHIFPGKIQGIQAFFDTLPADPHIYQNMCLLRSHINTVAAASAGNTTKSHFSLSLL